MQLEFGAVTWLHCMVILVRVCDTLTADTKWHNKRASSRSNFPRPTTLYCSLTTTIPLEIQINLFLMIQLKVHIYFISKENTNVTSLVYIKVKQIKRWLVGRWTNKMFMLHLLKMLWLWSLFIVLLVRHSNFSENKTCK